MPAAATTAPAPSALPTRETLEGDRGSCAVRPASERQASQRRCIALRSAAEIDAIRAAGELAADALDAARAACVVGATTLDIDRAAAAAIVAGGGEALFLGYRGAAGRANSNRPAYPASTCVSVNDELVHGVPGSRTINDGDVVSIDVGVRLAGWCADTATTVAVGAVSQDRIELLACAERMLAHAIAAIVPGRRWSGIVSELEAIAERAGYAIAADFVGHGIGRELHEAPQVPCTLSRGFLDHHDFTLRPGMVLAVEPMLVLERPVRIGDDARLANPRCRVAADGWTVTLDSGAPSCHFEHTVAVTRDGASVLTTSARAMRAHHAHEFRRAG